MGSQSQFIPCYPVHNVCTVGGTASTARFVSHMQLSEDSPQAGVHQQPCSSERKTKSQKNSVIAETTYWVTNEKCNSLGLFIILLFYLQANFQHSSPESWYLLPYFLLLTLKIHHKRAAAPQEMTEEHSPGPAMGWVNRWI